MIRILRLLVLLYLAIDLSACNQSPTQPSGSSVTSPAPSSPVNGAQIAFGSQPIVLTVVNATGGAAATYTFEVASDAGFTAKVATKEAPAGGNGSTSVTLDRSRAGHDYYWHARANAGTTNGAFSAASKFTVGADVAIQAPQPVSPLTGGSGTTRPTLTVTNATHTGSTGAIVYRFEISANAGFSPILVSQTVPEGAGQTSFTPATDLPVGTLFWHAQAFDATNNASSAFSASQSFVVGGRRSISPPSTSSGS